MTASATRDPVSRRRTFAIISHPDAGKTTLTEKLLLFGGAIQLAGAVKAKRNAQQTRSDWMSIERERGISVVTSVMTFEYADCVFNLLVDGLFAPYGGLWVGLLGRRDELGRCHRPCFYGDVPRRFFLARCQFWPF